MQIRQCEVVPNWVERLVHEVKVVQMLLASSLGELGLVQTGPLHLRSEGQKQVSKAWSSNTSSHIPSLIPALPSAFNDPSLLPSGLELTRPDRVHAWVCVCVCECV